MNNIEIGLAGKFKIQLIDKHTQEIRQELEFKNVLTNTALNLIGYGTPLPELFQYADVGFGSAPALPTDNRLQFTFGVRTNYSGSYPPVTTASTNPECAIRQIRRIFRSDQVNFILTEVGFWTSSSFGLLVNRSLFKDANGNVTQIIKTPSDELHIIYEYQIFAPQADVSSSVALAIGNYPVSMSYILRPQGVNLVNNWLRLLDDFGDWRPTGFARNIGTLVARTALNTVGVGVLASSGTTQPYVSNSFQRDIMLTWNPPTINNTTHSLVSFSPFGNDTSEADQIFQSLTATPIYQNNVQLVGAGFRILWNRK